MSASPTAFLLTFPHRPSSEAITVAADPLAPEPLPKKRRLNSRQSLRQPAGKAGPAKKRKLKRRTLVQPGPKRKFPCKACVTRAYKSPGHNCHNQDNDGLACWDCSKQGHAYEPVPPSAVAAVRRFWELNNSIVDPKSDPGDEFRAAGQVARRECRRNRGVVDASGSRSLEERKVLALEAIATAARIYTAKHEAKAADDEANNDEEANDNDEANDDEEANDDDEAHDDEEANDDDEAKDENESESEFDPDDSYL